MGVNLKKIAKQAKGYRHVLLVMRHGKADPFNASADAGRRLTPKGLKQSKAVAKGLSAMELVPDRVACSGADRARQTLETMLAVFGDKPKVDYRKSLYEDGVMSVFDEITHTKEKNRVLMVVGHEPTVSISCQWVADSQSDPAMLDLLNLGLSTGTVVVFGSNEPFAQWRIHEGDLLAVLTPKDFE